jgi:hypothetical protein
MPLTDLTKKGGLRMSKDTQVVFHTIKKVMSTFLVSTLPYFTHPLFLDCDAPSEVIGVVLMQNIHPTTFKRRNLREHEKIY